MLPSIIKLKLNIKAYSTNISRICHFLSHPSLQSHILPFSNESKVGYVLGLTVRTGLVGFPSRSSLISAPSDVFHRTLTQPQSSMENWQNYSGKFGEGSVGKCEVAVDHVDRKSHDNFLVNKNILNFQAGNFWIRCFESFVSKTNFSWYWVKNAFVENRSFESVIFLWELCVISDC